MSDNTVRLLKERLANIVDSFTSEGRMLHQNCPTLSHYTDASGLLGLLQNNELLVHSCLLAENRISRCPCQK